MSLPKMPTAQELSLDSDLSRGLVEAFSALLIQQDQRPTFNVVVDLASGGAHVIHWPVDCVIEAVIPEIDAYVIVSTGGATKPSNDNELRYMGIIASTGSRVGQHGLRHLTRAGDLIWANNASSMTLCFLCRHHTFEAHVG